MLFQKRNAGKKDNPLCSRFFYFIVAVPQERHFLFSEF